jgi:dTDP-4-dehydrorhamnose reductase
MRPARWAGDSYPAERTAAISRPPLELWGGVECTINRVGGRMFDQLARSGHDVRIADLDAITGLGLRTLRYPLLWERVAPAGECAWTWADERMRWFEARDVAPIVGLVHHGSGPMDTDLLDPAFPQRLAGYAGAVARRYPWATRWTPVNEPLTTARFSGLYGHWYPHHREEAAFLRMLVHQCRGVQLAMREIRRVIPTAQLIQTEDLGQTLSTPPLAYQAHFENERRWLSFDLLCGRVDPEHPAHARLRHAGVAADTLAAMRDEPHPDILGINHYLTSARFLDHRVDRYPAHVIGGNGRSVYADVEAIRVCVDMVEPRALLTGVHARYGLPIAVTEAHLGCEPAEQIRWLRELWAAALAAREGGADVRAVTAWALLGSFDWHCLVTRDEGRYEPGVFDIRSGAPQPTPLADYVRHLASGHDHPTAHGPGWWRRPERLIYPPYPPNHGERRRRPGVLGDPLAAELATD